MTVKLAKFFSNSNDATATPTPTPSPATNYYQQQKHEQQQQQLPPYYMDDDDNMSMYSTNASIMTARDHPYNNSQRPLLAERKPQLLTALKKKHNSSSNSNNGNNNHTAAAYIIHHKQQQQHQLQQQQKSYISPYVQQQKRDSVKGLHGFNDFDILSQQYNKHLCSPHIGYPYGSPPSPTANSSDFAFDALTPAAATPPQQQPRYGNISTGNNEYAYQSIVCGGGVGGAGGIKSSRFEDDFCCRRNDEFSGISNTSGSSNGSDGGGIGGPFIFGVSHESQSNYARMPAGGRAFHDSIVADTVHNFTTTSSAAAAKPTQAASATMQPPTTSDTSASSHDSSNNNNNNNTHNKAAKFLLRKRKSKSTTKSTAAATVAATKTKTKVDKKTSKKSIEATEQPTIKCVVVGDAAVGKTNLILSYLENRFNAEHVPTASDIYNADVMVNDSPVHLTLCDTAGQDTLDPLRELCYPDSDVFVLCFSVAKPETFHSIKTKWAPKFSKTKAALILVGTQADLRTNTKALNKLQSNGEKPISNADAKDLATTIGAKYIETSSVTQDKVKDVFDTAIWEGLVPTTLPPTPPLWKKLLCLA